MMMKISIVLVILIIVLVVVAYRVPVMKNPIPDYYTVQGRSPETDGPNMHRSRVPFMTWLKGRNLDY